MRQPEGYGCALWYYCYALHGSICRASSSWRQKWTRIVAETDSLQALEAEATQFDTYEDYLDHQIQPLDLYYL
jgi:hypothetical protein